MITGKNFNSEWSENDLAEVARWQRYVIWLVAAIIQASIMLIKYGNKNSPLDGDIIGYIGLILNVGFVIFGVYFIYNFAQSLRSRAAILYAIMYLMPLINLMVLLTLNIRAATVLRRHGIRVGLKGANREDLAKLQTDTTQPPIDKLRVAAIAVIAVFLIGIVIASMNICSNHSEDQASNTTAPSIPVTDNTSTSPAPAPPTAVQAPPPPAPVASQARPEQQPRQPAAEDMTITIGNKTIIRDNPRRTKYSVVFEDNGEAGYFYAIDSENVHSPVLDTLHIYDVASVKDRTKPFPIRIIWSRNYMQAALLIGNYTYAVFDFEACRGYCRDGTPAPNQQFTQYSHAWSDDALRFFR